MGQSNKNNKLIIGLIVIILAVIILLGIYYLFFSETEKIIEEPEIIIETDNRISPNENQGLTLEVLRIRNRELLNKIMNSGNSWKNKPNLYFITEIDGQEYISKNDFERIFELSDETGRMLGGFIKYLKKAK